MKKVLLFCVLAFGVTGCHKTVTAPEPPILGANNPFDQNTYQVLLTAHGIAQSLSDQAKNGTYTPTGTEKAAVNQFIVDLNAADILYAAYHGGTASQMDMQTAVNKVVSDQASLPVVGVK